MCHPQWAPPGVRYKLDNQPLPFVDYFKYLGVPFTSKGIDTERMLQASAKKGVAAMVLLHSLGAHKFAFGLGVALQVYRTFIRPIFDFEYGLAIKHTTATHHKILERAQDRCIRLTNGVTDPDAHTPTVTAKAMADLPSMKLRARILEFKFVVRAHELPPSTLLASVADTLLHVDRRFNGWGNLQLWHSSITQVTYGHHMRPQHFSTGEFQQVPGDHGHHLLSLIERMKDLCILHLMKDTKENCGRNCKLIHGSNQRELLELHYLHVPNLLFGSWAIIHLAS